MGSTTQIFGGQMEYKGKKEKVHYFQLISLSLCFLIILRIAVLEIHTLPW
jgi:hypothetical protein